jgi:hypothetical protein
VDYLTNPLDKQNITLRKSLFAAGCVCVFVWCGMEGGAANSIVFLQKISYSHTVTKFGVYLVDSRWHKILIFSELKIVSEITTYLSLPNPVHFPHCPLIYLI